MSDDLRPLAFGYALNNRPDDAIRAFAERILLRPGDTLLLRSRRRAWGPSGGPVSDLAGALATRDIGAFVLHYNPFSYGHWGLAPGLVAEVRRVCRSAPRIALLVHEPFVVNGPSRHRAMGQAQKAQLRALLRCADAVLTVSAHWQSMLERLAAREVHVVPVTSTLPDHAHERVVARDALGLDDDVLAVGTFNLAWPFQDERLGLAALRAISLTHPNARWLALGSRLPMWGGSPPIEPALRPGFLDAADLARGLAALDLILLPYVEGLTLRRTTFMAALQHHVPVVTTAGPGFPETLLGTLAVVAASIDSPESFTGAARMLAVSHDSHLRALRSEARELFDSQFSPAVSRAAIDIVNP